MTPADIAAPENGWNLACPCGRPIALGEGNLMDACTNALEHLKVCPIHQLHVSVERAVIEVITTLLWSNPDHYGRYRDDLHAIRLRAEQTLAIPPRKVGGCGACG
jgi:hypothetical protein